MIRCDKMKGTYVHILYSDIKVKGMIVVWYEEGCVVLNNIL